MKRAHMIVGKLTSTLAVAALLSSAPYATAGPLQEFGRDSVYARGAISNTRTLTAASPERFGRSSLYAADVTITPWRNPGRLPSTIAGEWTWQRVCHAAIGSAATARTHRTDVAIADDCGACPEVVRFVL